MADKIEHELASGLEEDLAVEAMAKKLAPRGVISDTMRGSLDQLTGRAPLTPSGTVEQKLQQIERLVGEIRAMSAQIKGLIG